MAEIALHPGFWNGLSGTEDYDSMAPAPPKDPLRIWGCTIPAWFASDCLSLVRQWGLLGLCVLFFGVTASHAYWTQGSAVIQAHVNEVNADAEQRRELAKFMASQSDLSVQINEVLRQVIQMKDK